jgi:hypothetical protein
MECPQSGKSRNFVAYMSNWTKKFLSVHIFKMAILTKFFGDLMNHITREYADKK